jgi:hypothetical protein
VWGRAVKMVLAIGSGALAWSGCSSAEQPGASDPGRGGSAAGVGAGSGVDGAGVSGAGGSGASAGTSNPRMCHVDCITSRYCEDGVVYRVGRTSSAEFPCDTPPPPLVCTAHPFEQCEHGCHENGFDCADAGGSGNAGASGQAGQGGEASGGEGGGA